MSKTKFTAEFEIRASRRMLFPYLSTASGLTQWFADDVTVDEDKVYNFLWDGESHKAKMVAHRSNNHVRFEFLPEEPEEEEESSYVELRLEKNEMTQTTFLRVVDFSDLDDEDESMDMWESMVGTLKETVGG